MSKREPKSQRTNAVYSTRIGNITGPVHTGSGDIFLKSFSVGSSIIDKNDFIMALQQFMHELEAAHQQGLDDKSNTDVLSNIEAIEGEVKKERPEADLISNRLKKIQEILVTGTTIASLAKTGANAVNQLLPLIENAIQIVHRIF